MGYFSFSKILTIAVVGYILYSFSSFYHIFHMEECRNSRFCVHSMFDEEMRFEIVIAGQDQHTIFQRDDIRLNTSFTSVVSFRIPKSVKNNRSYWIEAVLTPVRGSQKLSEHAVQSSMELTRLMPPKPDSFQLLGDPGMEGRRRSGWGRPEMHLYNKIIVTAVAERVVFDGEKIPPELTPLLRISRSSDNRLRYAPIAFLNRFLVTGTDAERIREQSDSPGSINTTVQSSSGSQQPKKARESINITISLEPASLGQLRLWRLIEHASSELSALGLSENSIESATAVFTHSSLSLLLIASAVAALHLLFDILAFKNDVSFWRSTRSTEGISGRTVVWRCISSVIVFLYLLEEETSVLVLGPVAIGGLIEFWKLARVLKFSIGFRGISWGTRDLSETQTDRLDCEGMRYLLWIVAPLCVMGAIYSLLWLPHKSWYSWTINTLANGVYVFGFLFMTPQLFINYKLKSVAHLPWKALTYKAFNTFIDDFFAFIVVMPTSHRLACFRDDIVFVVYIYQRWLYPVDKSRPNEFGQSFDKNGVSDSQSVTVDVSKKCD